MQDDNEPCRGVRDNLINLQTNSSRPLNRLKLGKPAARCTLNNEQRKTIQAAEQRHIYSMIKYRPKTPLGVTYSLIIISVIVPHVRHDGEELDARSYYAEMR